MPLNTEIIRNGRARKIWRHRPENWQHGENILNCMYTVAHIEQCPDFEYAEGKTFGSLGPNQFVDFTTTGGIYYLPTKCDLVTKGSQVVKRRHVFRYDNGKLIVEFKPGDTIRAWRSHKS